MNARVLTRAAVALALLAALLVVSLAGRLPGIGADASPPATDFTVTAQPVSASVQRGRATAFSVSVSPVAHFTGHVSLTASGLPEGTTAAFAPSAVRVDSATATSTLTVTTSSRTPIGSAPLSVTGTSGPITRTLDLVVVVSAQAPPGLSLAVTPASVSVAPGSSASYAVAVSRLNGYRGAIALSNAARLPAGVSMTVSPKNVPAGGTSPIPVTLTLTASAGSPASVTLVTVTAKGTSGNPPIAASGTAALVVEAHRSPSAFSLSGAATGELAPGTAPSPIDLAVTNPNDRPLNLTNLGVTVTGTSRSSCTAANFAVRQYAGSYPLAVAPHAQEVRLTSLGVPAAALPTVAMLDGSRDQASCAGVTVHLSYTGSATGR